MANTFRTSDSYILIGVEDEPGKRTVVGTESPLEDAHFQDFMSGKTNRNLHFSYIRLEFEGKIVGIFTIPLQQERPLFALKSHGKVVAADSVYLRNGSTNKVANADEIATMGELRHELKSPLLDVVLCDGNSKSGEPISELLSTVLKDAPKQTKAEIDRLEKATRFSIGGMDRLADLQRSLGTVRKPSYGPDRNELIAYEKELALLRPLRFCAKNLGGRSLTDVKLRATFPQHRDLDLRDCLPVKPVSPLMLLVRSESYELSFSKNLNISRSENAIEVECLFGKIQPGDSNFSESFFLGSRRPLNITISLEVFSDELSAPWRESFEFRLEVKKKLYWGPSDTDSEDEENL